MLRVGLDKVWVLGAVGGLKIYNYKDPISKTTDAGVLV